jgi:organic hydroperoxide reductase OsmC/OhrA
LKITAQVQNSQGQHQAIVSTNGQSHSLQIAPKASGYGSSANGGELLFLALATCYCNDIYREAEKQGIQVISVEVEVRGDFGGVGDPAQNVSYHAKVSAHASQDAIESLMRHTDSVAEIQNTLRIGRPVVLAGIEAVAV